jgi:transcription initiation factor IIE alpha subunit
MNPNQHFNHHISDPLYVRLEKKLSVRVQDKFRDYKKGWMQYCMRRKEKSVIERSLEKANKTIENIQTDARKRRNTTHL